MLDSPDKVDSFGEDDMGTLILVNVDDSAVGSVSSTDRAASLSTKSSQAIHRTASLYVFDASEKGIESNSGRILLSASNSLFDKDSSPSVSFFFPRIVDFLFSSDCPCILYCLLPNREVRTMAIGCSSCTSLWYGSSRSSDLPIGIE
jgi:hypothetical protein